jgi:glycosyltransferase involved in cell wall biosynthesis/ribosomal protein S18 acetylase RimI-like enzyme
MKIAHLTTVDMSLRFLLLPQLEAARELGEVLGISAPGPHVEELEARGIRHVPLEASTRGMSLSSDLRAAAQLWRIIREERPDILHTHNPKPGVYGRIFGRLAGVPIVVNTVHGLYASPESPMPKRAIVYALEGLASRFSDAELVQNPEDLELLGRLGITPRWKLRLLGNGVDLERFNPDRARESREAKRAALGLEPDDVVVGFVGRLVAEKGLPELIEAAEQLDSAIRLVVVGPSDPDKTDSLSRSIIERGERAGVRFLGMRSDVADLYGAFDIFVLPSHREGYPRAAMEAAASGLPVIATDIRGCRQVVSDGVNGMLVPVRDPDALAGAMRALATDPDLRRRMGEAGFERSRELFDEDRVVEIVMDTYRDVARRKGLDWDLAAVGGEIEIREAEPGDAPAVGSLHSRMIRSGFLSSLGPGFLRLLYESLISGDSGAVFVAVRGDTVVGFIAGTDDTGRFYREFLRTRSLAALWNLLPALIRPKTWAKVIETLRYGSREQELSAELLSMAVAPAVRRRGVGARLVEALLADARSRGLEGMKVVVGAENRAALSLYESCGFEDPRPLEVHTGVPSLELIWSP